ncbi:MAG: hypothetical protein Q4G69_05880 [Planctomycetia bacterium]|nr:hypothetical protein [Planctomycetia bacterium]
MSRTIISILLFLFLNSALFSAEGPIDRKALVARHKLSTADPLILYPVGNGELCFNVDGTGLQTFCGDTLAHWGWHESPLPDGIKKEDVPLNGTYQKGRNKGPDALPEGKEKILPWLRANPHLFNLARIRFIRGDMRLLKPEEITKVRRNLDLWTGIHQTDFILDGKSVHVETAIGDHDQLGIKIISDLLSEGALQVVIDFPYLGIEGGSTDLEGRFTSGFKTAKSGWTGNFHADGKHSTIVLRREKAGLFLHRTADDLHYDVMIIGKNFKAFPDPKGSLHHFLLSPRKKEIELVVQFGKNPDRIRRDFNQITAESKMRWDQYWKTGGAIDLSKSTDKRWRELERRIVLSQFLMRSCSAGSFPSAESGLLAMDPWGDRFHMEMVWWHLAHYFLWNRDQYAQKALECYQWLKKPARSLAEQCDYKGYQWQKAVGPSARSQFWSGNLILLWKQPHPFFFAELDYRNHPNRKTLDKWADILEGTAEFMADYPVKDEKGIYHLDPVMPPSEIGCSKDTVFDLAYWRFGLKQANIWRERMGKDKNANWEKVLKNLAPLPVAQGVFVHSSEWSDTYTKRNWEHPDPVGVFGMLPPIEGVDPAIAKKTVEKIINTWQWSRCWGWDFPWTAMAAARTGQPDKAIEILFSDSPRNQYDLRGVNLGGPCPYLPGNGGLLYAIAMMAAGWDGAPTGNAPGFPKEGWKVQYEGLKKAP